MPLTHGQHSNLALHSKMLLALLNPLLDCEQLHALKLTQGEANKLVSLMNQAVEDPYHLAQDATLLSLLRVMIWITHEYSRGNTTPGKKKSSEYEKKLKAASLELKSNPIMLVNEGILSVLKPVLKLRHNEELQATAAQLLWSLSHDTSVKTKILDDNEIVGALQEIHTLSSLKLKMASHCTLWLLGIVAEGLYYNNRIIS